jgi:hypothetical protein
MVAKQATNGRVTDHAPTQKLMSNRRERTLRIMPLKPLPACGLRGLGWGEIAEVNAVGTKNSLSLPTGTAISNSKSMPTTAMLPSFAITVGSVATQNRTGCQLLPSALGSPAISGI